MSRSPLIHVVIIRVPTSVLVDRLIKREPPYFPAWRSLNSLSDRSPSSGAWRVEYDSDLATATARAPQPLAQQGQREGASAGTDQRLYIEFAAEQAGAHAFHAVAPGLGAPHMHAPAGGKSLAKGFASIWQSRGENVQRTSANQPGESIR